MAELRTPVTGFSRLTSAEQEASVKALLDARQVPLNGEVRELDARIAEYQQRFGMSSDEMRGKLASGDLVETVDICRWLMLLKLRDRVASRQAPADAAGPLPGDPRHDHPSVL